MKKILKLCGFLLATSALFLIIASLALYHFIRVGEFRGFLISQLEEQTGFDVSLGEGDWQFGSILGIGFRDLALSEPSSSQPVLRAERITARVALLPLWQRKLVFYEIRLLRPSLRMARDENGRIPLLDKILNLPLMQRHDSQFQFDLRSLRVQNGQIEWMDHRAGAPITFRLLGADAEVRRLAGQAPRELSKAALSAGPGRPAGSALQFALQGILEKDAHKSRVSAKGKLVSLGEVLALPSSWLSADVELDDLPADLVLAYVGPSLALRSLSGRFDQQIRIEGRPSERLQVSGSMAFSRAGVDAPELFAVPLALGDGRASFVADWSRQRVAVAKFDFQSADVKFSLQGEVRNLEGSDPHFDLILAAPPVSIAALKKLLPSILAANSQAGRWAASLQDGELDINRAGMDARLSQIRRWGTAGLDERVWFDAELRNVAVKLDADGALPLHLTQGRLSLEKGVFAVKALKANYGNSRLSGIDAFYTPVGRAFSIRGGGDLDLAEIQQQLGHPMVPPEIARSAAAVQELVGRARIDVAISRRAEEPLRVSGTLGLDRVRVRKDDYLLTDVKGALLFNPAEIKGEKITASLSGSPVEIDLHVKPYGSPDARFDLSVQSTAMKAGVLARLLIDTGSPQDPGLVRGTVRYAGSLADPADRLFTGTLDLLDVQLAVQPLLQPLRELSGRIHIDEKGIDFHDLKGLLAGFPSRASGRWRHDQRPQLVFDFTSPNLDLSYLISQVDPESTEFYNDLQAQGRIALASGRLKAFEFRDLTAAVTLDRRVWRLNDLIARSSGGAIQGSTIIADRPDTLGMTAQANIHGIPVESFLRWFDATTTDMTGRVHLTGSLSTSGKDDAERKRNANGAFNLKIEDGTIKRMRILVQILNLLDLSRWFTLRLPDLSRDGIRFRTITGDFKVNKGVYLTENLVVDSDDLRMTGSGRIDAVTDEIQFLVAVRPFAALDSVINYIPLLGRGIAAIKNSFLVASFNITGPIDNPIITPAPLGTLAEWFWGVLGIPKNMIGAADDERNGAKAIRP